MRASLRTLVATGILVMTGAVPSRATPITTTYDTSSSGGSGLPFGPVNQPTIGQTFIAPSGSTRLKDFTFYVEPANGTVQFQAAVFAWTGSLTGNGGQATGPALYTSAPITFSDAAGGYISVPETVTPNLKLTPGQNYVALFTLSGPDPTDYTNSNWDAGADPADPLSYMIFGSVHSPGDGGGGLVYDRNGSDYAALTSGPWTTALDFGDLTWKANFVAVPEPSSLSLMLGALAMLGGVFYLRRRKIADQLEPFGLPHTSPQS